MPLGEDMGWAMLEGGVDEFLSGYPGHLKSCHDLLNSLDPETPV